MRLIVFIAIVFIAFPLYGQHLKRSQYQLELKSGSGFLIAHRASMRHLLKGNAVMYEASLVSKDTRLDHLGHFYGTTELGVNLHYMNVGNMEEIGACFGLYPSIRIPLSKWEHGPKLKIGAGLGYVRKPFHQETNNQNIAIGSYMNALIQFCLQDEISIKDKHFIKYGIGMTHYSNAAFSAPNLGMNIPTMNLAYAFQIKPPVLNSPYSWIVFDPSTYSFSRTHEVFGFLGAREVSLHDRKKYLVGSINYQHFHQFSGKLAWTTGADLFGNSSLMAEADAPDHSLVNMQFGGFAGLEILFNSSSIFMQYGVYVFSPYKGNGATYNRIGFRNRRPNGLIFHIGLKTHLTVAEYFELGIGYSFKRKEQQD